MPYYTLKNLCDVYKDRALTSNYKYTNPYLENGKIDIYDINTHDINSNYYLQNNLHPCTKSYANIVNSYPHFLSRIIQKKKIELEKDNLDIEIENLQKKIDSNKDVTTTKIPSLTTEIPVSKNTN